MRIDLAAPLELGVSLLGVISYDLVVAFFQPDLAIRFANACVAGRVGPPLVVLAPGLRHQCAQLQRVLAAACLPAAAFIRYEDDDGDVRPILAGLERATYAAGGAAPAIGP
ncbi:hypothetical protein HMPREF3114_18415 [Stenotrophomonas sp. HMSC10F07]|nr:hypothetical protein HMPREF3114_18415 [Stenotrophomonas sp. HMSC10F07]